MQDKGTVNFGRLRAAAPFLPGTIVGLYAGRLLSELLRPGPVGTVLLTLGAVLVAAYSLRRAPLRWTWPAVALLLYVAYPDPDPRVAALAAAAAGLLAWQIIVGPRLAANEPYRHPATTRRLATTAAPAVLFLAFLALYTVTLAQGVLPADGGELQAVAAQLGVAHPPGFALYTVLAHLATRLPLPGSVALKVNFYSAVTAAATVTLVYLSAYALTRRAAAGLAAALALGTATTFWAQAVTANVRSLTAFFAALALFITLAARNWKRETEKQQGQTVAQGKEAAPFSRLTTALALTLSLGVVHHASLLFMAAVFVAAYLLLDSEILRTPGRWLRPLLAVVAGLLPLLYFPLRATAAVRGASPDLATWDGFWRHVLALGFQGDLFHFLSPQLLWLRLRVMADVMAFQFHPLLLAAMALGMAVLLRRDRWLAFLLGGSFALHTLITATYRAPQTVEYLLPAYVPAVLLLAAAAGWNSDLSGKSAAIWRDVFRPLLLTALLLAAVVQGVDHFGSYERLQRERVAETYASELLEAAPEDAVILADWHWATPLWYLQEVEGVRPQLSVHYVFPTTEAYGETWARRIAEEMEGGRAVVATHYDAAAYGALPLPLPLGDAFLFGAEPPTTLPAGYRPLDVTLDGAIRLLGYRLEPETVAPTHEATLTLAWQAVVPLAAPTSLFAHLIGADGALYAQEDVGAQPQPGAEAITLTQFRLTPRPGAAPGAYSVAVGAYRTGSGEQLTGEEGQERVPVGALTVTVLTRPLATENAVYRPLAEGGGRLVGYDWDVTLPGRPRLYLHRRSEAGYRVEVQDVTGGSADMPPTVGPWGLTRQATMVAPEAAHYVPLGQGIVWLGEGLAADEQEIRPGETLVLPQRFAASRPVRSDAVVSVRLVGYEDDGVRWAWWDLADSVPGLGAIPTLKWIGGSRIWDPHRLEVAEEATAGQTVGGLVRLYDAFTGRTIPILDERILLEQPAIPLGTAVVGETEREQP